MAGQELSRRRFVTAGAVCAASRAAGAETTPIRRERDKRTGREVWQVTAGDSISHSCYFEAQPFTADDRYLVYSSNRGGSYQLYAVELETGATRRLTQCRRLSNLSFSIHPNGRDVIFLDGGELWKTEVASGAGRLVVDLAKMRPGAQGYSAGRTFSADGVYTPVGFSGEGAYSIALLNLRTTKIERNIDVDGGTGGHMLLCPAEPHLITFVRSPDEQNNMKLPMERRARTMIADLRAGAIRPFLTMPYGWRATHEYWDSAGARFYFHQKKVPGWVPASICSMKRDGSDWKTHFTSDTLMLGHSMISHDNRFIVSDVQKPGDNPLVFIDLATGRHEILCWPDSSVTAGHSKQAHVHPSISRSGKLVAYTSDRTGTAQVYVVPL